MGRLPRVVIPGVPYHVTQRGTRRQPVFFSVEDYLSYLRLLRRETRKHGLAVWTYCLMPNHVHLIVVPSTKDALSTPLGIAHRQYARRTNATRGWTGHLWQERFTSAAMDEQHLLAAARYVLLNPVRSGLVERATDWRFSSASAHVRGARDPLVDPEPLNARIDDWQRYLVYDASAETKAFARHRGMFPLGSDSFVDRLERESGVRLRKRKAGRKPGPGKTMGSR